MSNFKRFDASENRNYNSGDIFDPGTLTWDPDNGLRIHDGNTYGGNTIGVTDYGYLQNRPNSVAYFLSGYGSSNDGQFIKFNINSQNFDFLTGFRVIDPQNVSFPDGTPTDQVGDTAFTGNFIYVCKQQPNIVINVAITDASGYSDGSRVSITSHGSYVLDYGNQHLTDGVNTSRIIGVDARFDSEHILVRVDPAVPDWHSGTPGTLTLLSDGGPARTNNWRRFPSFGTAPAHSDSDGIAGQIAVDENYLYYCSGTSDPGLGYSYDLPYGRNTSPFNWTNQSDGTSLRLFARGDNVAPQNGWKTNDGTNVRTITNVFTQNSGFGVIYDLTLDSAVDYSTATTIMVYERLPMIGQWRRIAWSNDTW